MRVASLRPTLVCSSISAHKLSRHALYVDWENQSYSSIDRQGRALCEIVSRLYETTKTFATSLFTIIVNCLVSLQMLTIISKSWSIKDRLIMWCANCFNRDLIFHKYLLSFTLFWSVNNYFMFPDISKQWKFNSYGKYNIALHSMLIMIFVSPYFVMMIKGSLFCYTPLFSTSWISTFWLFKPLQCFSCSKFWNKFNK